MIIRTGDLMENMNLKVTIKLDPFFRPRIWLGTQIIRLAAFIIGCGVKVDVK